MIQKKKSLFLLATVVLLTCLLFCGQSYAQGGDRPQGDDRPQGGDRLQGRSKITDRLLALSQQKLKGALPAPAYGENPKVDVLFTAAATTDAVDFSFFTERKIEYQKSRHYIEASIDAALIPELDSIAGIKEIDISFPVILDASAGNALMNVTDYNNSGIKGAGVKIGVLDSQYDGYQSRLSSNVISADFTIAGFPPVANSGTGGTHGTTCAGIFYDIVPEAQMYIARISGIVSRENAYEWCFNNGVKIISISMSVSEAQAGEIASYYTDKGILTVASAGNFGPGPNTMIYAAREEKVLTAGSIDISNIANWNNGIVANMSSRGPGTNGCIKPEIACPSLGGYTSYAAPHAAGAAAILLSIVDKSVYDTPAKLKALVISFARPIGPSPNNDSGYGKLVLPDFSDFVLLNTTYNLFAYEGAVITFPVISKNGAHGSGMMIIPEKAFSEDVTIQVKQQGSLAPAKSYVRELNHTNMGVHIDAQGKKPAREIELRIPYNESDIAGMNEESLVISRYDEEKQVWVPLKSKAGNGNKQIITYLDHLSVFAIMGTMNAVKAFDDVKYYPNPIRPSKGLNYSKMSFSNIPVGTHIKIYTMLGQVVRELKADASGMAVWDGKNNTGEKAASGVYIVYMEDGNGNKKRIKVAVER